MNSMSMDANVTMSANDTMPADPTVAVTTTDPAPAPASGPPASFTDAIKAVPWLGWVAFGGAFF